jgi:hypothetical protein
MATGPRSVVSGRHGRAGSDSRQGFIKAYGSILASAADPEHPYSPYRTILEHLASPTPPPPLLVHCTAGKDSKCPTLLFLPSPRHHAPSTASSEQRVWQPHPACSPIHPSPRLPHPLPAPTPLSTPIQSPASSPTTLYSPPHPIPSTPTTTTTTIPTSQQPNPPPPPNPQLIAFPKKQEQA